MKATSRMTKQRKVILDVLRSVTSHPTAEELYSMVRERIPRISLGTVYRNLDLLTAAGDVCQLSAGGTVRRFDGDIRPHCHVRCVVCGKVGDVWVEAVPSLNALDAQAEGFTVTESRLEFYGVCAGCAPCQGR